MTDDDARTIATRIIDTWPTGPKAYIWRNELAPLDVDLANEAFRIMRNEVDKATTAAFHERYRALQRKHGGTGIPRYDYSQAISFTDHVTNLTARANAGDQRAADELDNWQRVQAKPSPKRRRR